MIALAFKSKKGELKDASPKTGQSSCLIAALLRAADHPLLDDRSIRGIIVVIAVIGGDELPVSVCIAITA